MTRYSAVLPPALRAAFNVTEVGDSWHLHCKHCSAGWALVRVNPVVTGAVVRLMDHARMHEKERKRPVGARLIGVTLRDDGTSLGRWVTWVDYPGFVYTACDWPTCPCCGKPLNHGLSGPDEYPAIAIAVPDFGYNPFTKKPVSEWLHVDCYEKWRAVQLENARQAEEAGKP